MSHLTQGTWNLIFIGWAVQLIGYALMFGLPPILKKRRNKRAASNQRQKLLSAFWKSEHERLWPMLRGSFEKVPEWSPIEQLLSQAENGMVKADEAAQALRSGMIGVGIKEIPPFERINTIRTVFK